MALAALAPSRASTVRICPTETARCRLDAFFAPQLADLAAMLGDEKWRWPEYRGV